MRGIEHDLRVWRRKPLLRAVYRAMWERLAEGMDRRIEGPVVEIGSGVGGIREMILDVVLTDVEFHPWLDLVCDGYRLPFADGSISHLLMTDVFHHLEAPYAFMAEARRVLRSGGRLLILEPYIGWIGWLVYGLLHPEPIGWRAPISQQAAPPVRNHIYAAQGNATRIFFGAEGMREQTAAWRLVSRERLSCLSYLLSGGFSRPAVYPARCLPWLQRLDAWLSRWPRIFAARCLVVLSSNYPGHADNR